VAQFNCMHKTSKNAATKSVKLQFGAIHGFIVEDVFPDHFEFGESLHLVSQVDDLTVTMDNVDSSLFGC